MARLAHGRVKDDKNSNEEESNNDKNGGDVE